MWAGGEREPARAGESQCSSPSLASSSWPSGLGKHHGKHPAAPTDGQFYAARVGVGGLTQVYLAQDSGLRTRLRTQRNDGNPHRFYIAPSSLLIMLPAGCNVATNLRRSAAAWRNLVSVALRSTRVARAARRMAGIRRYLTPAARRARAGLNKGPGTITTRIYLRSPKLRSRACKQV